MALSAQQITYLKTADQRFRARIGLFDAYAPTITAPTVGSGGQQLLPTPVLRCAPRYQLAAHEEVVDLYGKDSYVRGGAYVGDANISFALDGGSSGSVSDNGDGTATYTAPASGVAVAQINITVTNANGSKVGYAFVQYPNTTYDEVVTEIATLNASVESHGYKLTLRARGDVGDFAIGKGILLHVEDTWGSTTSTFGGYKYDEGVFFGYISDMQQFEDFSGDTWLGVEVQSPWWLMERTPFSGETYWGQSTASGRFWIADFRPVDVVWHYVNEITDFTLYHDVVMWFDSNTIDDFYVHQGPMAGIVEDLMARTLSIVYCDRYGSLFCVPDPDVRADEFWGTPAPTYTGSEILEPALVMDYNMQFFTNQMQELTLAAFDRTHLGLYAISTNPTALGDKLNIRGLLCDDPARLASWAVQKRAQMNRAWELTVTLPLNHTMDLVNFADVNFTAPNQVSGKTASGRTWLGGLTYRPDPYRGGWVGSWDLRKQTEGDGEAETGALSGWAGGGITGGIYGDYSGSAYWSGWTGIPSGGPDTWTQTLDFVNDGASGGGVPGWNAIPNWSRSGAWPAFGSYVGGQGWQSELSYDVGTLATGRSETVGAEFAPRTITGVSMTFETIFTANLHNINFWYRSAVVNSSYGQSGINYIITEQKPLTASAWTFTWAGSVDANWVGIDYLGTIGNTGELQSVTIGGLGTNPFLT